MAIAPETEQLDLSGAAFSVSWREWGLHQVLALMAEEVWFWSFVSASAPWGSLVGSFRCESSNRQRRALLDIASRVLREQPGGGLELQRLRLLLSAGPHQTWVEAGSPLASRVRKATAPLLSGRQVRPVSAIRLQPNLLTFPGYDPMLGLKFEAIGTEPSILLLKADEIYLIHVGRGALPVPPPEKGLESRSGAPLDGLRQPATIPAGGYGLWAFQNADAREARRVLVAGTIQAGGPIPAASAEFVMFADIPR